MQKEFEMKGYWWLPEDPENKIQGTLKYQPNEGIHLETLGFFGDIQSSIRPNEYDIILGVNLNNKPITLVNCFQTGPSFRFPGFQEGNYFSHLLLIGDHFCRSEDIRFKEVYARFTYIDEWINIYGFNIEINPTNPRNYSINYNLPHEIIANISEECSVSLYFTCNFNVPLIVKKELNPKQMAYFRIKYSELEHYKKFLKLQHLFQDLLTLATGERSFPLEVFGVNSENGEKIDFYYNPISKIDSPKEVFPHEMIFTFSEISKFEEIIKNWFEKAEILRPVYILYFATRYHSFLYLENRFLNLIQALETYHSRVCDGIRRKFVVMCMIG